MKQWFAAVVLFLNVGVAYASALDEIEGCRLLADKTEMTVQEAAKAGYCGGLLYSIKNANPYLLPQFRFCAPNSAMISQFGKIVVRYLDNVPERQHEPFFELALEALRRAWPCR
jgi:hypothetical protein